MTKYRYIDDWNYSPGGFKQKQNKAIKIAIIKAIKYPSCLYPLSINIWNYEELNRYDKRVIEQRRLVGSYLK